MAKQTAGSSRRQDDLVESDGLQQSTLEYPVEQGEYF